jgi:hypothetical protein
MQFASYNRDEVIIIKELKSEIKEIRRTNDCLRLCFIVFICVLLYYLYVDNEIRVSLAKATRSLAKELMCLNNHTYVPKHSSESN